MTESDLSFQETPNVEDAFLAGKLEALRILYREYLEANLRGVKTVTTGELLNVIRTLILNLGGDT